MRVKYDSMHAVKIYVIFMVVKVGIIIILCQIGSKL